MIECILIWGDGGHARMLKSMVESIHTGVQVELIAQRFETNFIEIAQRESTRSILGIGDVLGRSDILRKLDCYNIQWLTLVSPHSTVMSSVTIGDGTVIMPGVMINNEAHISSHCVINTGSIIEHDAYVGRNTFIGPGTIIAGTCSIGNNTTINSNVTIAPGVSIGDSVIVGAVSFVNKDLNQTGLYFGIPVNHREI